MMIGLPWIASWLVEVYGFATILLVAAALALLGLKQAADRLAVARATLVALVLLGPLVAACRFARELTIFEPPASRFCCPPERPTVTPINPRSFAIIGVFAVGSSLAIGWLGLGALASARLLRRSRPAPEAIRGLLAKVAGQGRATPRLLVAAELPQPVALGLIRPAIILPAWFAEQEPDARIELALAHEWAHVSNGDLRLLALSRALLPLLFAHPLFAWLRNRVRVDQEALADLAASRTEGRIAYAEALLDWSRSTAGKHVDRMMPALGFWDRTSILRRRIELLLDGDLRLEPRCSSRWRATVGALTCACLIGLGGLAWSGPFDSDRQAEPHTHAMALPESPMDPSNVALCCPVNQNER